jgi:hypothetical protein
VTTPPAGPAPEQRPDATDEPGRPDSAERTGTTTSSHDKPDPTIEAGDDYEPV